MAELELEHHCHECGYIALAVTIDRQVKCKVCNTINDVWIEGESIPERHLLLNTPNSGE